VDLSESDEPTPVELRVDWGDFDAAGVLPSNQFVAQLGLATKDGVPDGVYVTFGHVVPPVLLGPSNEDIRKQIEDLGGRRVVQIQGSYLLTRGRLTELIEVLQTAARQYDSLVERRSRSGSTEEADT
jgi:hypothetical protein